MAPNSTSLKPSQEFSQKASWVFNISTFTQTLSHGPKFDLSEALARILSESIMGHQHIDIHPNIVPRPLIQSTNFANMKRNQNLQSVKRIERVGIGKNIC
jgi:hypothetical protein